MTVRHKIRLRDWIKAAVSIFLLGYLLSLVGWQAIAEELRNGDPYWIALYFAIGFLGVLVSAFKWRVLCAARRLGGSFWRLSMLYFVGMFFNQLLPTNVGGDVVRGYELGRQQGKTAEAMASVFVERCTGLATLIAFGLVAALISPGLRSNPWLLGLVGSVACAFFVGCWLIFSPWALAALARWNRWPPLSRGISKGQKVQAAIRAYSASRGSLVAAIALSVAFYALAVVATYAGCRAFGVEVPIAHLFAAVPVILLLFLIPISLGGIGLQEWAYFFVLESIGVPAPVGISVGLLFRARTVLLGLIGGVLYSLAVPAAPDAAPTASASAHRATLGKP